MSIVSNISTAFFSDCNTFATPTDPSYTKVVSFNKKIEQIYHPILPSSLLYRIAIKGSMELVYYISVFNFHRWARSWFQALALCGFDGIRNSDA